MAKLANGNEIIAPTETDVALAKESGEVLAAHLAEFQGVRLRVEAGSSSVELTLPPSALRLLARALSELGHGNAIAMTPVEAELTTQQAAGLLNVSRPHLVKLLDEGAIPSRKVGSHRRVPLRELLAFKGESLARRHAALDELQALSQDLDMGY